MAQNHDQNGSARGIPFSSAAGQTAGRQKAPAAPAKMDGDTYIDALQNSREDLTDIKTAESKKLSQHDKRVITVLAALDILVFLFIGVYIYVTGSADAYDIDKLPPVVLYDPADAFAGEMHTYIGNADFPEGIQQRFMRLYSENNDSVGWVRIDGTSIDYPVLRGEDNKKYERANFYGEYDRRGSIFMDNRNTIGRNRGDLSKVTVLWGHHLTEDMTIFADVEKYMDVEYYKAHPVIEMDTLFEDYQWKVFACFTANTEPEDDGGNLFYYWDPYISDNDTPGFINECVNRSWFVNPALDYQTTDKILCLSTCTYILNKDDYHSIRCVLMARLVRKGEDASVDVSGAYQNENRRMPQLYYDINGIPNPYAGTPCWTATD